MRKGILLIFLAVLIILFIIGIFVFQSLKNPKIISNQNISGTFMQSQIWQGDILITGDVLILADLAILPGTKIRFVVGDDKQKGYETAADGYNDWDPTRLISYGKTHASLTIEGKLTAKGTNENRILFTSAEENKKIADWEAIYPFGDGSIIEYAVIEYSRNGISSGDEPTPNSIFRNNIIRYAMWGPISTGWSSVQVYNNEIYECGHEGIDVQGGNPIIQNNTIYDCHTGIVVLRGSAIVRNNNITNVGDGVHVGKDATPVLENNYIKIADQDSKKEWRYGNFAYILFGDPVGTSTLTEVYTELTEDKEYLPRYATPLYKIESAYKIENQTFVMPMPFKAQNWLVYGWKNGRWQKIEIEIIFDDLWGNFIIPANYSMYVFIPNPTDDEMSEDAFNKAHADIYKIMAV